MSPLEKLIFGTIKFRENEELDEFKFRFLVVNMVAGALITALLIAGAFTGLNPIAAPHVVSMCAFTGLALAVWLALRGRRRRFLPAAWSYEIACILEFSSSLAFVPQDELRGLWFLINVPGVYILLGRSAGAATTLTMLTGLLAGNRALPVPYSPNALATLILAITYLALIFHFYSARSISFFLRMRASNQRLRHLAAHDGLTGVLNGRSYQDSCEQFIRLARRTGAPWSVLFVDLDHFKRINDQYGHAVGDQVLRAVSEQLKHSIRTSDLLGRVGGEEFSLFLPNTDQAGAARLAEAIRKAIEGLALSAGETHLRISASIGVAAGCPGQSIFDIQRQADSAMYAAKAQGRNRVSCFRTETA